MPQSRPTRLAEQSKSTAARGRPSKRPGRAGRAVSDGGDATLTLVATGVTIIAHDRGRPARGPDAAADDDLGLPALVRWWGSIAARRC